MKCPECGEEMIEEFIFLMSAGRSSLAVSKEEPGRVWAYRPYPKERVELLKRGAISYTDKKYWLRKSYRCPKCEIIIFKYREEELEE